MLQEIRLHGHLDEAVEYFVTAAGPDLFRHRFHDADGTALRFFAPGNELLLDGKGVLHRGNGGTFCEYMFGVDQPLADLAKPEVRNRLVLYGAVNRPDGSLHFTSRTEGRQTFEDIFREGNAICNTFFFLTGLPHGGLHRQQEEILRRLGRLLKRTRHVGPLDDAPLVEEIAGELKVAGVLCLLKLIHKPHRLYHDRFRALYSASKSLGEDDSRALRRLAEDLGIDKYQQERIRIDVLYQHPDNRRLVDEYRSILIDCSRAGQIGAQENARLTRLKTLAVRKNIPSSLFASLDERLKYDSLVQLEEQEYLAETREALADLFLQERQIDSGIETQDIVRLLEAKRRASENRDHTFEQILLETGRVVDERIRDGADMLLMESFSRVITFFDRYDTVAAEINHLGFMENGSLSERSVRSLLHNRRQFDHLGADLFDRLFFRDVLQNRYLGRHGRHKVLALRAGLQMIEESRMTVLGLLEQVDGICRRERLETLVAAHLRARLPDLLSEREAPGEQESLRLETERALRERGDLENLPAELFREVLINLRKEAVYVHHLLPQIARGRKELREDFLTNSGLDRFHVEELEREFFEKRDQASGARG